MVGGLIVPARQARLLAPGWHLKRYGSSFACRRAASAAAWVRAGDREKGLRYGKEAQQKAATRGQAELAATIARDLRSLEASPPR